MTERPSKSVVVTAEGRRYRIERHDGLPDTVTEYWPGRGVVSSERAWLGHDFAKRVTWYAAIKPTGEPFKATERVEDLPSRRAAIRWLLSRTAGQESAR
jgi:hypothetical protein